MLQIISTIIDILIQLLFIYIAYMFLVSYKKSKKNVLLVFGIIYLVLAVINVPHLIFHHFLGIDFVDVELYREIELVVATGAIAWAVLPRAGWKAPMEKM